MTMIRRMSIEAIIFSLIVLAIVFIAGCDTGNGEPSEPPEVEPVDPGELPVEEEPQPDRPEEESPLLGTDHYWPLLNLGDLVLSSGEYISGPDMLESDPGFMAELSESQGYEGRLVWRVEESNPLTLEWIILAFDVEYYEQGELAELLNFEFEITGFGPLPPRPSLQEIELDLVEQRGPLTVSLRRLILGQEQESVYLVQPFDYLGLELEMKVEDSEEREQ